MYDIIYVTHIILQEERKFITKLISNETKFFSNYFESNRIMICDVLILH